MASSSQPSPQQGAGPAAVMAGQGSSVQDPSCHDVPVPLENHLTSPGVRAVALGPPALEPSDQSLGGIQRPPSDSALPDPPHPSTLETGGISKAHAGGGRRGDRQRPSPGLPRLWASRLCTRAYSAGKPSLTVGRRDVQSPSASGLGPGPRGVPAERDSLMTAVNPRLQGRLQAAAALFLDDPISSPPLGLTMNDNARAAPGPKLCYDPELQDPVTLSPAWWSTQGGLLTSLGTALTTNGFPATTADPEL